VLAKRKTALRPVSPTSYDQAASEMRCAKSDNPRTQGCEAEQHHRPSLLMLPLVSFPPLSPPIEPQ
jgi:hypothetical protein